MEKETKLRPLCLLQLLYKETDEDHPLSTNELIELMAREYNLHVYRTTIASDVEQLKNFGIDIRTIKMASNRYYIGDRLFRLSELKLLIDAVESSKFITEEESKVLVGKLVSLAGKNKGLELTRNLCTEGRLKPDNDRIYDIVDTLNAAINQGRKVSFQYFQYNVRKEQKLRHDGEVYIFSPYTLVWNGDYYYVVGFSDKHQDIGSFRVDRIYNQPKILREEAVRRPDNFDEAKYIRTTFRMFGKEPETVELICDNDLMDAVIDKFGRDVKTYAYSMSAFKAEVEVAASRIFYRWVFGFGGRIKINAPASVKNEYREMVLKAAKSL